MTAKKPAKAVVKAAVDIYATYDEVVANLATYEMEVTRLLRANEELSMELQHVQDEACELTERLRLHETVFRTIDSAALRRVVQLEDTLARRK